MAKQKQIKKMIIFPNEEIHKELKIGSVKNNLRIGSYVKFLLQKKVKTDELLSKLTELTNGCDAKEKSLSLAVLKVVMEYRGSEVALIKKLRK